jgi:hypothetical protein
MRASIIVLAWLVSACTGGPERTLEPSNLGVAAAGSVAERRPAGFRALLESETIPRPGATWRVRLRMDRAPGWAGITSVSVEPPPGMTLRRERGRLSRDDLVVEVDVRGSASGYHAELRLAPVGIARPMLSAPSLGRRQIFVAGRAVSRAIEVAAKVAR